MIAKDSLDGTSWEWFNRHAALIILVGLLLVLIATGVTIWLARLPPPAGRTGILAALGAVLSILGVAVSLGGFALTLQQLSQTKTSIDAASKEAERIRLSLKTYDATQDATRAEYALQDAKRHFDRGDFPSGSSSYSNCASSLVMIRNNVENLPEEINEAIDLADKYIENLCIRIDKGNNSWDFKQKSELRSHDRLIKRIQTHLQRSAI